MYKQFSSVFKRCTVSWVLINICRHVNTTTVEIENIPMIPHVPVCLSLHRLISQSTTYLFSVPICLSSPKRHLNGIIQFVPLRIWFLSLSIMRLRFIHFEFLGVTVVFFSLYLNSISLYGYTTCLIIYELIDI